MNDEQHSFILKSIADETRLRLIRLLSKEELNVQEICDILQLPQPRISRHLATLKQIKLLRDRRDGTRVYYSLCLLDDSLNNFKSYISTICGSTHTDLLRLESTLKKRTEFSREFAGNMAEHWDEISVDLHSPLASMFSMSGLAPRGLTVADLGCGTGIMLPMMSRFASNVYAVDHSINMLDKAKRRCEQLNIQNIKYISSDFNSLKDKISGCDAVLLHFVLHQVATPQTIVKELLPVLKPGGRIVIVDQQKHDDESAREKYGSIWLGFEEEQICNWFDQAGFIDSNWLLLDDDSTQGVFVATATKD